MLKRRLAMIFLTLVLVMSLTACGGLMNTAKTLLNDYPSLAYDQARDTVAERNKAEQAAKDLRSAAAQIDATLRDTDPAEPASTAAK